MAFLNVVLSPRIDTMYAATSARLAVDVICHRGSAPDLRFPRAGMFVSVACRSTVQSQSLGASSASRA